MSVTEPKKELTKTRSNSGNRTLKNRKKRISEKRKTEKKRRNKN